MREFRKFCQRVSKFDNVFFLFFFLLDEGKEDSNVTLNGPSFKWAFRWRADDGPTLNSGLVAL